MTAMYCVQVQQMEETQTDNNDRPVRPVSITNCGIIRCVYVCVYVCEDERSAALRLYVA